VQYAPINPSDFAYITGEYPTAGEQQFPWVIGFEGSGIIEEVGDNLKVPQKVGDRVAFSIPGAWANYAIAPADVVYKIPEEITFEQAANFCTNPWTVELMVKLIREGGISLLYILQEQVQ
jgi:NADPH2:quinone reductase